MGSIAVLGVEACQRLGLTGRLDSAGVEITEEYADSVKGLGCLPCKCKSKLYPIVPLVIHAPRKLPVSLHERVMKEIQRMETDGVVRKQQQQQQKAYRLSEQHGHCRHAKENQNLHRSWGLQQSDQERTFSNEDHRRTRAKHTRCESVFITYVTSGY